MRCEVCSSEEFVKNGDFFVCQVCRVKYTIADMQRLLAKDKKEEEKIETEKISEESKEEEKKEDKVEYPKYTIPYSNVVRTYTADQFTISGRCPDGYGRFGDNYVVFSIGRYIDICGKHNFYDPNDNKYTYGKGLWKQRSWGMRECKIKFGEDTYIIEYELFDDGSVYKKNYGFEYNLLECLHTFIEHIADGSSIIGSEKNKENTLMLHAALDKNYKSWPVEVFDQRKSDMIDEINELCKKKNITLDFRPRFLEVTNVKFLHSRTIDMWNKEHLETYYIYQHFFSLTFGNGETKKMDREMVKIIKKDCEKYNLQFNDPNNELEKHSEYYAREPINDGGWSYE